MVLARRAHELDCCASTVSPVFKRKVYIFIQNSPAAVPVTVPVYEHTCIRTYIQVDSTGLRYIAGDGGWVVDKFHRCRDGVVRIV